MLWTDEGEAEAGMDGGKLQNERRDEEVDSVEGRGTGTKENGARSEGSEGGRTIHEDAAG